MILEIAIGYTLGRAFVFLIEVIAYQIGIRREQSSKSNKSPEVKKNE